MEVERDYMELFNQRAEEVFNDEELRRFGQRAMEQATEKIRRCAAIAKKNHDEIKRIQSIFEALGFEEENTFEPVPDILDELNQREEEELEIQRGTEAVLWAFMQSPDELLTADEVLDRLIKEGLYEPDEKNAIQQICAKLAKTGSLNRASHGVYYLNEEMHDAM